MSNNKEFKSRNIYDINNIELELTNKIDNSDFILLKNGTIKQKRKKNSYIDEYLKNKRLNKAINNATNIKRVKSCFNVRNNKSIYLQTNSENLNDIKKNMNSDTNIFNKAQKINIFENVILDNSNNDHLKLSFSYNNINNNISKINKKNKYIEMIEKKQNKIDKYENLIKTKNMYKDLWKNLKNKKLKKNMKQKNNSKKKKILENRYNDNNLKIVKHEIIEYNPYISNTERKKTKTYSDIINNINNNARKNLMLNFQNLIVFKNQKGYKHYDNIGNNYSYYERNESEKL